VERGDRDLRAVTGSTTDPSGLRRVIPVIRLPRNAPAQVVAYGAAIVKAIEESEGHLRSDGGGPTGAMDSRSHADEGADDAVHVGHEVARHRLDVAEGLGGAQAGQRLPRRPERRAVPRGAHAAE